LLSDAGFRLQARLLLIERFFAPDERIALLESLGLPPSEELAQRSEQLVADALKAAKRKGRCARFAVQVVTQYRFTCALTGYRCVTADGAAIVDAAHIEAWSRSQNDDLTNGLALSKNAQWMFDEGLWSADDQMRIVVNPARFAEAGPDSHLLATLAGHPLHFAPAAKLRPAIEHLRNHRRRFGMG
jgi:putative restriction endonuclease